MAVPIVLVLYFLKLRRQIMRLPSTLLWRKSTEDLQVNTPFQRLRASLLLFLQLLLLASLLLALGQPVLEAAGAPSARVILLIDQSASMNVIVGEDQVRLDLAKQTAEQIVERLRRAGERTEIMVASFASSAQVKTGFESNHRAIIAAIRSIRPTDEQSNLEAGFDLAGAFAMRAENTDLSAPDVIVISDGVVAPPEDPAGYRLRSGKLRFISIGADAPRADDNIGIASFTARRDYEDPARVLVFARLINAGSEAKSTPVTLRADNDVVRVRSVETPAADSLGPGEAVVSFELQSPGAALLSLTTGGRDALPNDDSAALLLREPSAARIAVLHRAPEPDSFLHELLIAMEPQRLVVFSTTDGAEADRLAAQIQADFDLIIFDRVAPDEFPRVASMSIGAVPASLGARPPSRTGGKRILSWDRQHPVMRHVSLDGLVYGGFGALDLPPDAVALASGADGPVVGLVPRQTARHVVVGFELLQSNWPVDVSFVVFLRNAISHLTYVGDDNAAVVQSRPGEPVVVRARHDATVVTVNGPLTAELDVTPGAVVTLPALRRVGAYAIGGVDGPFDRIPVSMLSEVESDIRVRQELLVNAQITSAGAIESAAPLQLWPWLAGAALLLILLEWVVYCRRMRG